jgi:PEP-CTERM motif
MSQGFRQRACGALSWRTLTLAFIATQSMNASWIQFNVTSLVAGQSAVGFEQIFRVTGTGAGGNGLAVGSTGFDYTYLVWNTGVLPIDGFFFDVGVPNTAAGVNAFVNGPQGADTFTAAGGGDLGIFPNAPFVGGPRPTQNINGELGVLNPYFFDSSPINPINGVGVNPLPPLQGVLQTWGFEQFWNPGMTAYLARFYANTPGDPYGPLPSGFITRFDVYSPFGPVAGGGGVDPLDSGNYIGIDDPAGDLSNLILSPAVTPCDPTVAGSCDMSLPAAITGVPGMGSTTTANSAPEPGTIAMMVMGLGGILLFLRRRI